MVKPPEPLKKHFYDFNRKLPEPHETQEKSIKKPPKKDQKNHLIVLILYVLYDPFILSSVAGAWEDQESQRTVSMGNLSLQTLPKVTKGSRKKSYFLNGSAII